MFANQQKSGFLSTNRHLGSGFDKIHKQVTKITNHFRSKGCIEPGDAPAIEAYFQYAKETEAATKKYASKLEKANQSMMNAAQTTELAMGRSRHNADTVAAATTSAQIIANQWHQQQVKGIRQPGKFIRGFLKN